MTGEVSVSVGISWQSEVAGFQAVSCLNLPLRSWNEHFPKDLKMQPSVDRVLLLETRSRISDSDAFN
jgi:hypothetical protein